VIKQVSSTGSALEAGYLSIPKKLALEKRHKVSPPTGNPFRTAGKTRHRTRAGRQPRAFFSLTEMDLADLL
jgi:hypothetical protein